MIFMRQTIQISTSTILKTAGIILGLVLLYLIKTVLVMLFLAVIIAAAVDMPIDWLVRHKIRRGLAVAIVYVFAISALGAILYLVIPALASQIKTIATSLPDYILALQFKLRGIGTGISDQSLHDFLVSISNNLAGSFNNIILGIINLFGGFLSAIFVLIISIYLAVREQAVKKFFLLFVPEANKEYAGNLLDRMIFKLGAWLRGQIVLMAIISVLVYIALKILKIKFALTLALLAGLLEIVPIIGPIISAIPGILFAFLQYDSIGFALVVALAYYIVQELEKYLIVPFVMKKAVGLNPISIMVAVLVGAELYGIIGAVLAIPVAALISIGFADLMERRKNVISEAEKK